MNSDGENNDIHSLDADWVEQEIANVLTEPLEQFDTEWLEFVLEEDSYIQKDLWESGQKKIINYYKKYGRKGAWMN